MKITVSKLDLLKECQKVLLAVENKTSIPILANFLFQAEACETLVITGTTLDIGIVVRMNGVRVHEEGSITIPARRLLDVLKNLKTVNEPNVTITTLDPHDTNWISVVCGPLLVKIPGMAHRNFPVLPAFPEGPTVQVDSEVLAGLIERSKYAISYEESRYTLNGALLVVQPDGIQMVATDGHRLAIVKHPGVYAKEEQKTLIPRRALDILTKLLAAEMIVEIAKDSEKSTIFFRCGNWTMSTRVLTGQFPNYEAVIPKFTVNEAVIMAKDLKATVARVAKFADERSQAVSFRFRSYGTEVSASSTEGGEAVEEVKSQYTGDELRIGFNASYVLDVLDTVGKDDAIVIRTKNANDAAMFVPFPENGFQSQNIVMPMRI